MQIFNLDIVKEQYSRMGDEELTRFAINESQKLTLESFHLLKTEFEKRGLDIGVIENAETERMLEEMDQQRVNEHAAQKEFAKTILIYALDQKEQGKTNVEVYNGLRKKGLTDTGALMVIASLETKSRELADAYDTNMIVAGILFIIGLITIAMAASSWPKAFAIYGLLLIGAGIIRFSISSSKKAKYKKIADMIAAEEAREEDDNFHPEMN